MKKSSNSNKKVNFGTHDIFDYFDYEKMSPLFGAIEDIIITIDKDGKFLFVAPTSTEFLAFPANQIPGKSLQDLFDKEQADSFKEQIFKCLKKNQTIKYEYPLPVRGRQMWFDAKISPLDNNTVIWVIRDITERKRVEKVNSVMLHIARAVNVSYNLEELFDNIREQLSQIINTNNFFIALYDHKTNRICLPYFRDEKDSFDTFPVEKTISSIVFKEKRSLLLKENEILRLIENGEIIQVGSLAKVWLGIPLLVEGKVLGIMVVQDYIDQEIITEEHKQILEVISPQISLSIKRKQSEELLRESEKILRESNITKDRFFNIIAHDLKNPFNVIIGFSNLLLEEWNDFDNNEKFDIIKSIKNSSESAYDLLTNLLEWSRLQVGKLSYNPEFIDVSALVKLNFSLLQTQADAKSIQLIFEYNCDKFAYADSNMINTVLRNLISNAIKFTMPGGFIKANCKKNNAEHPGMVIISVKDNGIGINPKDISNIFNLDGKKNSKGTQGETGTGLGLVLCKEFVEKNKGKIWVESVKDQGTTIYVALPFIPL